MCHVSTFAALAAAYVYDFYMLYLNVILANNFSEYNILVNDLQDFF